MRLVFDTCALLRLTLELGSPFTQPWEERLDADSCFLSAVSIYEIAWKNRCGRLELGIPVDDYLALVRQLALTIWPVDDQATQRAAQLDWTHRDPFDRIIVTEAERHKATLLTVDRQMVANFPNTAW